MTTNLKETDSALSKAMKNPAFVGTELIYRGYLPNGFSNFKIEGRSLGSAIVLEFLLYYMTKPEYQLNILRQYVGFVLMIMMGD